VLSHDEASSSWIAQRRQSNGWWRVAVSSGDIEQLQDGADVDGLLFERSRDGRIHLARGEPLEQLGEAPGVIADVATALRHAANELSTGRGDVVQAVERAVLSGLATAGASR
jgi:hypothetical protein